MMGLALPGGGGGAGGGVGVPKRGKIGVGP